MCWERVILRFPLSHEMGLDTNEQRHFRGYLPRRLDVATTHGPDKRPDLSLQELRQCCSIVESLQDFGWGGLGGASGSEGGVEVGKAMITLRRYNSGRTVHPSIHPSIKLHNIIEAL